MGFLRRIEDLSSYDTAGLEELLYQHRFELLPPQKQEAEGRGSAARGASSEDGDANRLLPHYQDLPSQGELHDLLLNGHTPGAFQCVAHVLYPETIPWPAKAPSRTQAAAAAAQAAAASASEAVAAGERKSSTRGSSDAQQQLPPGQEGAAEVQAQASERTERKKQLRASKLEPELLGMAAPVLAVENQMQQGSVEEQSPGEVLICGQKVSTTRRGKPVLDTTTGAGEDQAGGTALAAAKEKEKDDEKYNRAKANRIRLERESTLEQYQEKKLLERIQVLETMRAAELSYHDQRRQRESKRQARNDQLKAQLSEGYQHKIEAERVEAEQKAQAAKEEVAIEQRRKQQHEKQKEELGKWYADQRQERDRPKEELARERREKRWTAQLSALQDREQTKSKTVKQQLVEERLVDLQEALEQRPPLPPRGHDRAGSLGGSSTMSRNLTTTQGRGSPQQPSLVQQAKAVSNMYGLSPREHATVEANLLQGVNGAGRMGTYEKPKEPSK